MLEVEQGLNFLQAMGKMNSDKIAHIIGNRLISKELHYRKADNGGLG